MSLPNERPAKTSPWSLRVATISGIPVRLHATFLLFLFWLGSVGGIGGLAMVVGLFLCVLLHEFGHALAARHYGIGTRDITLYPIGGLATLTGRMRPRQELWVALAGPAVNVVLAAIIWASGRLVGATLHSDTLLGGLFAANVVMAAFNMIPAFPMDGGRVLRALLARGFADDKATRIAAAVGQTIAAGLFLYGLLHGPGILALVAVFVFLGAGGESRSETIRAKLAGRRAVDAMRTRFLTLSHGARLESAAELLRESPQTDFPVVSNDTVIGLVSQNDIAQGLAQDGPEAYVAGRMRREPKTADPDAALEEVVELLTKDDPSPVLIVDEGRLVGMVGAEDVGRFLVREDATGRARML